MGLCTWETMWCRCRVKGVVWRRLFKVVEWCRCRVKRAAWRRRKGQRGVVLRSARLTCGHARGGLLV